MSSKPNLRRKSRTGIKLLIIFLLFISFRLNSIAQPNWIPGSPAATPHVFSIELDYGIDDIGKVYIILINYNFTGSVTSATVKSAALAGPVSNRISTWVIDINAADVGVLQNINAINQVAGNIGLIPNQNYTFFLVAENSSGILQATPIRVGIKTLPCPQIDVLTGFSQPVTCINLISTARFNVVLSDPDPEVNGIFEGTQWILDWGDGNVASYTSVTDNDVPPVALRTHTYTSNTDCNYVFTASITNPCGESRSVQYIAVVHGRDIPADGDGQLEIVDDATGSTTIEVCAGTESVIIIRDNSTWNCQNPSLPGSLIPVPNSDPRNLEWLYGQDPGGGIHNTITGAVTVGALGSAPQTSGRISPLPNAPGSLSESIIIPSTCLPGETFRVYLKNWNKCNWADADYVSTYVDIVVVDVPDSPTAADRTICEGDDPTLTVTSAPLGTISWYAEAARTTLLGTGLNFTPPVSAVGIYTYWVTDQDPSGNNCESYPTPVTLVINQRPGSVSLSGPKKNDICFGVEPPESYVITASPSAGPAITGYQWYRDGIPVVGRYYDTLIISKVPESGLYTCASIGAAPSYCLSDIHPDDTLRVTVHTLLNVIQPVDQFICENGTAVFQAITTEDIANWQWERSTDGGLSFSTVSASAPYTGFNTSTLTITAPGFAYNGFWFRVEMKTPNGQGGCAFKSDPALLTVYGLPSINAGPDLPVCTPNPLNPIAMTGTVMGGTASSVVWSGGGGLGTWTQNANPALATFTPLVPSGSFTATITVTGMAACGGTVVSDTRVISWSQTPQVNAGADISRCDATPFAPFIMTGATASGSYNGLNWSGGAALGTWTQNADPAFAVFTPSVPSGSFTATLSVNGLGTCLGTNPSDTRIISWGETPVAFAGSDIAKCDITPLAPILMSGATATGKYTGLTWSGGEAMGTWNQNANPALATFTPSVTSGTFVATLSLSGTGACTGSDAIDTRLIDWGYEATVDAGPDQSVCATASVTLAGVIGGGATTATWSGGAGTFNPDNTTLNAVYTPSAAEQAAQSVTLTLTTDDPPGLCPVVSDQVIIEIGTLPTSALLTSSGDECFGAASSWINIDIDGGASPYIIQYELNGMPQTNITNYFNSTNHDLGLLPVGTYNYEITAITDGCGNALPPAGLPAPVSFEIFENPVANGGSDKFTCGPLSTTIAAIPSIGTGMWTKASGPGTVTFFPDQFSASATATADTYGSYILRWTEVNGGICTSTSDIIADFEKVAAAGGDQDICGTLSATLTGNVPAVGTGTWTKVSGPGTVTFTPNANTPGAVATVSVVGTYEFRWTISNSGLCSTGDNVIIIYNPAGQVNQPSDLVVCNGLPTGDIIFTTSVTGGTTTYAWTNSNTAIGLGASGTGDIPSFTAINATNSPVSSTVVVTPTYHSGTISCPGTPKTFTITVNPTAQVNPHSDLVLCEGSTGSASFSTLTTGGTATFNWTNSEPGIGLPANGTGDFSFTATNATTAPLVATIEVTPQFSNGGVDCTGPPEIFTITVNPGGQVDQPADQVACNNSLKVVSFTTLNTGGITTYDWTNDNTSIGLGPNGSGPLSFTATNPGTTPLTANITVTPTFNNSGLDCTGSPKSFIITVYPTPVLSSTQTPADICSNSIFSYTPASAIAGTTFNWTRADVVGITPAGPTTGTDNPNELLRNMTNTPIGVTYQYTLAANGCTNIQNVIVNVKPEPVIAPGQVTEACSGNTLNYPIQLVNFTNPGDNVYFTWPAPVLDPVDPGFYGGTARLSASMSNISDLFINVTGVKGVATYTVTPFKDGCPGESVEIVDTVPPQPVLNASLNTTVCSNIPVGLILSEAAGSVPADYYNISQVILDPGLSADPGNAFISNPTAPANYIVSDRFLNITGVDKKVIYRVQPVHAPDCFGDTVDVEITIRPQPYIIPAQTATVCSDLAIGKEVILLPANTPAGTVFNWGVPVMSDFSGQGTAGVGVSADPAGTIHINDVIHNSSGIPINATYNITPTSAAGCVGTQIPVVITINPEPVPKAISGKPDICINEINQVYNVNPAPGSLFNWTVDPAIGTKTFDFNTSSIILDASAVPGSGNISVYETNTYGCDGDLSALGVQVHDQALPENVTGSGDVCANSTQVFSVTNRPGSFYSWSIPWGSTIIGDPSASSVTVIMGTVGGDIKVTEFNIAGCPTVHIPLTVVVRPLPTAVISGGGTICEGGSASLTVDFTGTAPFTLTYAINGVNQPPVVTSDDPYTLVATVAGTYTIASVEDASGCSNTGFGSSFISYYPKPTGIISGDATICGGQSATLTMTFTGTPPYTFTYSDGTTPFTVPNFPSSVYTIPVSPAATTTYVLTALSDGNGCTAVISGSATITVNQPPVLSFIETDLTCFNDNSGAVDMTVTGNSPFAFAWTGPAGFVSNFEDITGLAAGTYNVTVTDTRGCSSAGSATLTEPGPLNGTVSSTDIYCFGETGEISITTPSGGSGSYEYSDDGGITWQASGLFPGLNPGFYDVRMRDQMSPVCNTILNAALEITGPDILDATVTSTDVTCFGASNGSIIITGATGGFGTYQYSINNGGTWQGSGNFVNLGPGTYQVLIRDGAYPLCVITLDPGLVISEPALLVATVNSSTITCYGASDGEISITGASGGSGAFEYSINGGGSWHASGSFTALGPGLYNVQVRDAAMTSCYMVLDPSLAITQPAALFGNLSYTNVTCNGASDGTISITLSSGGSGSYEYTTDGWATWQGTGLFTSLPPGSYDVRMRDVLNPSCELVLNSGLDITEPPALSASYTSSDISCAGASDGMITVTNQVGGYGTYQYSINGGITWQATGSFSSLPSGLYDVRIRDASRQTCVLVIDPAVSITEPAPLFATASETNVTCFNANNGTITVSGASGGYGSYEYSINGGASWQPSPLFINLGPNTYDVRMRDALRQTCYLVVDPTLVITEPSQLSATLSSSAITCNGASDGIINITGATGGYGSYDYTIDGGTTWVSTSLFTGLPPGFYNVMMRDAASTGCVRALNGSLSISEPGPLNANLVSTSITCNGANDGTITISGATGGYGSFEFTVDGGITWQGSGNFSGLIPDIYDVRMRDVSQPACEKILNPTLVITEPAALGASVASTNITCNGASNGTIAFSGMSGGSGSYEYSINGGSVWTGLASFSNLPPATYDVRIRDAVNPGCQLILDATLEITEPPALVATVSGSAITCYGAADGIISITGASGGYGAYEFSINGGGSWQSAGLFTGLGPGYYNVVMRDATYPSCIKILNNALLISQPAMMFAIVTPTNVSCNGADDGIINITGPTGGSGAYDYSTDGGITWQPSGLFPSLTPATYDVRIRDAANISCVITLNGSLTITEPAPLNANLTSIDVSCNGADDGKITVSFASGGYGTYEYTINGGFSWQSTGTYTGLAPATYDVRLRDAAHTGCVTVLDPALEITEPPALTASVTSTNITCNGASNGTITVAGASGGYGTYQYSINGGVSWQATGTFIGLAPGTYNVVMRDASSTGCTLVLDPMLMLTEPAPLAASYSGTNVTCSGASDGTITINGVSGGYGTYEYTINGGATWQLTGDFTGLGPGFYNIQVRDAAHNACALLLDPLYVITEPGALAAVVTHFDITCNGAADGVINITLPTGGYGAYEYSIDGGGTWQGTGSYSSLPPGTYTVMLRDAASILCVKILDPALVINEPAILDATVAGSDVTCNGASDGVISVSGATGGYGVYQYTIDGGISWFSSGLFTGLAPSSYDVQIRDASNPACIITLDPAFVISQPDLLTATVSSNPVSCFGASDGSISITGAAGGYGTYEYSINGGGSWQSSPDFSSLSPGIYNIRMRDALHTGCFVILDPALTITQPAILSGTVTATPVTCNGASDGIITISGASGGYGSYEYSVDGGISWQGAALFTGLPPATYDVRIRDASVTGCVITLNSSLTITEPAALSASVDDTPVSCNGSVDGVITITGASGGYGTYGYSVDGGTTWQSSPTFPGLAPGFYDVQIHDAAHTGCVTILDASRQITEPAILSATVASTDVTCNGASDGIITFSGASGGYGTYEFSVNGGSNWQATGSFPGLAPGFYTVMIRDAAHTGCTIVIDPSLEITEPPLLSATVTSTPVTCYGASDGTVTISGASGGYGTYEYSVNGGIAWQSSGTFSSLSPGYYNVRIRDAAHTACSVILNGSLQITQPGALTANLSRTNVTCFGGNDGTISITNPAGGYGTYEYSIDGGTLWQSDGNFINLPPATYNVAIRDEANPSCVVILSGAFVITEPALLDAVITVTPVSCNGGSDGIIEISAPTGGSGAYHYSTDGGITWKSSGIFMGLSAGTYDIWIRDAAAPACMINLDPALSLTQPGALTATVTSSAVTCYGAADGTITITGASGGYGTYEYSVNSGGSWSSSGTFTGLTPGNYNVQIRDAAHTTCFVVLNPALSITQPAVLSATVTGTHVTCNGASDGTISITGATGGHGTYDYSIDGGITWQGSGTFTGLPPDIYNVRIRDAGVAGCEIILNPSLTITEPALLSASVAASAVTCNGADDGVISITGSSGGYGTYEYTVDGGLTWQSSGTFPGLTPGFYSVEMRDAAHIGCSMVLNPSLEVTEPAPLSATVTGTPVTCYTATDGEISVTGASGGYGTYEYSINNGISWQGSGLFVNLAPGTYIVMIRDAAHPACETVLDPALAITRPDIITATVTSSDITCNGASDGTITVAGTAGGYGTYEYSVDAGVTWQSGGSFTGLGPGFYSVRARDAAFPLCVVVLNSSLRINEPASLAAFVTSSDVTCNGSSDGRITVSSASGGYGSYEYSIDGGLTWHSTGIFSGLIPGSYNVQIRDLFHPACVTVLDPALDIAEPGLLSATVTVTDITCNGAANGIITLTNPSGGTGAYQYSIDAGISWQGSGVFMNLVPAGYDVRIRDAINQSCVIVLDPAVGVTEPALLEGTVTGTNVSCYGAADGIIDITGVSGGYGTYEYSINGGGTWQSSPTFTGLSSGNYVVLIRDAAHIQCMRILINPFAITQPALLSATITSTPVSCYGASDGTITINGATGGYGTYEYTIDGGITWSSSASFTGLNPGSYDVRIRDMANPACFIILFSNLVISEPLQLQATSTGDILLDCYNENDGFGTFYASGGSIPYTFTVLSNTAGATIDPPGFNTQGFSGAGAGVITVMITDKNGCTDQATITVTQPAELTPGSIGTDQLLCQDDNPALLTELSAPTGGPGVHNYQWQFSVNAGGPFINISGATANEYTPPPGATQTFYYRRMVSSGICTPVYSNIVEILVNPKPVAVLSGGATICPSETTVIKADISSGTGPFELDIAGHGVVSGYISGDDITVSPALTTTYSLARVTDVNGCEVIAPSVSLMGMATVIVRDLPVIGTSPTDKVICEYGMTQFQVTATGTDLSYQWFVDEGAGFVPLTDNGVYVGSASNRLNIFGAARSMDGNLYRVAVTGCFVTETSSAALLTVNTNPEIATQPDNITVCQGNDAGFRVIAAGTAITYQWQENTGSGFVDITDDAVHSGTDTDSLTILNTTPAMNGWIYRVIVKGICSTDAYSSFAVLNVTPEPVIVLQPLDREICEGLTTSFLVNATGPGISYQWQYNNGSGWINLSDGTVYSGTQSQQLRLDNTPASAAGQIRAAVIADCQTVYSNAVNLVINSNPVVDFTGVDPMFTCGGSDLLMNGNPTGGSGTYVSHTWTGQTGPLSSLVISNPVFNTNVQGAYSLSYSVTDSKGCQATDNLTVNVEKPTALFNPDVTDGCPPLDVVFSDASIGGVVYRWDFGDGFTDNTAGNATHQYTNASTSLLYYDVTLEVETANGCTDDYTVGITVYPQTDANFDMVSDTICSGEYAILSSLPGAYQYFWSFGDGQFTYGGNVINHLFVNSGTSPVSYTIRLTTTSFYGCDTWIEKDIVVYPMPLPGFTATPPSQTFPASTVVFNNTTNTGTWNYAWTFGDNTTSSLQDPVHTYAAPGNYQVGLTVSNSQCIDSVRYVVSVLPTAPIADFDSIPGACAPYNVTFTNNSLYGTSYQWDFGDGGVSYASNPSYEYPLGGIYRVRLTVTGPGGVDYMERLVEVFVNPRALFEAIPDTVFVDDEDVRCFNLSERADSYIWEFGDGDTSMLRDPYHKYRSEGVFPIKLHAYSDNGCYDSYELLPGITVLPAGEIRFATVFRPNKTGPIDGDSRNISSHQVDMLFFPPVKEQIDNYKLQIFNRSGVLIFESNDINVGWNGYYKGQLCMQGVYVWYVEGKYSNGRPFRKVGDITLLH